MGRLRRALSTASPRERGFTAAAGTLHVVALLAAAALALRYDEQGDDRDLYLATVGVLVAAPILVGALALVLFGAKRRLGKAASGVGMGLFALLIVGGFFLHIPVLLQGPRWLLRGAERGTVDAIARSQAAWVEVTPTAVDLEHIGEGTVYSRDIRTGYTRGYTRYAAPILAPAAERTAAPVTLFLCARTRDSLLAQAGAGTVRGRMAAPEVADGLAIENLRAVLPIVPQPRCIRRSGGSAGASGIGWLVVALAMMIAAAYLATWTALAFSRNPAGHPNVPPA